MDKEELKNRTKSFAIRILKLGNSLPNDISGRIIANQIIRSGTSVAANYRASCRSRSNAEFISKLGVVLEECDETRFWLEMIMETNMIEASKIKDLYEEADELNAIFYSSIKTAKRKNDKC
jgi:four helix bundle protein